jgi:RNA polymerase sigma-70 factor, ECF subfamily
VDDESAVRGYVQSRDPKLFRLLVERHQQRVLRLVASLLGPHADLDAQEVTQEVFLRACERLHTFRGESKFSTWLYRLTYNRTLEHRRHARILIPHVSLDAIQQLASDAGTEHIEDQRRKLVAALLEELPDVYRSVINMHYWLDQSVDEIAQVLDIPAGTVKSYLFRARQQLRKRAQSLGIELD